jgi:hypothetical protein
MLPAIPKLPPSSRDAVKALANAAFLFRGVFVEAGNGRTVEDIIDERYETLMLSNAVLDHWLRGLGIDPETGEESGAQQTRNGR